MKREISHFQFEMTMEVFEMTESRVGSLQSAVGREARDTAEIGVPGAEGYESEGDSPYRSLPLVGMTNMCPLVTAQC